MFVFPAHLCAQEGLPVPPHHTQTFKLSDLDPEVASKIKAEHYAAQDRNIQHAYQRQLHANQQRSVFAAQQAAFKKSAFDQPRGRRSVPVAYQAPAFPRTTLTAPHIPVANAPRPLAGHAVGQTYMPPVHIPPPQNYSPPTVDSRSVYGRRIAVENFAPQAIRTQTHNTAYRHPGPPLHRNKAPVQPQRRISHTNHPAVSEDSHVFLQDRISNALTRRFKKGKERTEVGGLADDHREQPIDTQPVAEIAEAYSVMESDDSTEIVFSDSIPTPVKSSLKGAIALSDRDIDEGQSYADILNSNRYAAKVGSSGGPSTARPDDHQLPFKPGMIKAHARQRSIERAVHHDLGQESLEVATGDLEETIFDRYESIRQTSGHQVREHGLEQPLARTVRRRSAKPRTQVAALPRPDKYPSRRRVPANNVSVLSQKSDNVNPEIGGRGGFNPRDRFDSPPAPTGDFDSSDRPNLRDDLRDVDDEMLEKARKQRARVRSRLDDELDLGELDRELDEDAELEDAELDLDDESPNRVPRKSCIEFQDELLTGSIRDISLDISPPAASEGAQYGGLARTWSDRRGNILATGALVDMRRGYVILDSGQKLAYSRLSEADLAAVSEFWRLPEVCLIGNRGGSPYRNWTPQVVTWKASNLCHKPLFFENVQLERYGHSRGPIAQPIHSTLHFFVSLVSVPYNTAISPPNECEYALGFYRPGNCAPWLKDPVPISLQGIRREALFVTGAAFIP